MSVIEAIDQLLPPRFRTLAGILVLVAIATAWMTSLQIAVAESTKKLEGIESMQQDIKWIKNRLGGPSN